MKVGLLTGGGDCAGLNAALGAAAQCLIHNGVETLIGFEDGFLGMIEKRSRTLGRDDVSTIIAEGGTILGSCNKASPSNHYGENRVPEVVEYYRSLGLDGIVAIGGDGTMSMCHELSEHGLNFIGVPKTIDNDIVDTDQTFGFDSAVTVVMEAMDRLHTTARSHRRTMVLETMGRYAGWIALYAGIAGNANVVLIPEIPFSLEKVARIINERRARRLHTLIVVAEGASVAGGTHVISQNVADSPDPIRLGGIGRFLQQQLEKVIDCEIRSMSLGHIQRGGAPTSADRILATVYGYRAARLALEGRWGRMVSLQSGIYTDIPIGSVANKTRTIPEDHLLIKTARECGISFAEP